MWSFMMCHEIDVALYDVWPAYEGKTIVWRQLYYYDNFINIIIITTVFELLSSKQNKQKK
jgi:hypothetical protein